MYHIEYQTIPITEENINLLEQLRYNAYGIDSTNFKVEETYHAKQLREGKYLVFGCFLETQLAGACYISNSYNSLYIEQLFIKKEYQRSNLHLGSNLLKYILKNKQIIENYFQTNFYYSYLDTSKNNEQLFLQLGYQEKNFLMYKNLGHK